MHTWCLSHFADSSITGCKNVYTLQTFVQQLLQPAKYRDNSRGLSWTLSFNSDLYHSVTSNMWRHRKTLTYLHTHMHAHAHTHAHTHTHVYRYQKGKTNLDFTEARDSGWQWHQLGHVQGCTLLKTDNHTSTPPLLCVFTGRMPFLSPNQQCQSTEGILTYFSSNASRAILTNGHTGHVPRAPGFFFLFEGPKWLW